MLATLSTDDWQWIAIVLLALLLLAPFAGRLR
jgi:hypothetical protein